jgi:nucleoside 2-deoxyribosyltransferase
MLNVYLGGPITGLTYRQAQAWRQDKAFRLSLDILGLDPLSPLDQHGPPSDLDIPLNAFFEEQIGVDVSTVVLGDLKMIEASDIVLFNFLDSDHASIGSAAELGWANAKGKPIVSAVKQDTVHHHPFVTVLSKEIAPTLDAALMSLDRVARSIEGVPYA